MTIYMEDLLYSDDEAFVRACYRELLGREADEQGLAGHVDRLKKGRSRALLVRSLLRSTEAKIAGAKVKGVWWSITWIWLTRAPFFGALLRPISWYGGRRETIRRLRAIQFQSNELITLARSEAAKDKAVPKVNRSANRVKGALSPRARDILIQLKK